ncbi:MAG: peptidoglycan-binding protein [Clostridia bacterium]|nr:peptidoglycan-binding protein [Clostridia bacterium]
MKRLILIGLFCILFCTVTAADDSFELLKNGSEGEPVVRVQERLFDLGYYTYKPTGSYYTVTRSAVMDYQSESGLGADGTIGEETYRALFSDTAVRKPFRAVISLGYTAQGANLRRGTAQRWEIVKTLLEEGNTYSITNAYTGESCTLLYEGGENHAEFSVPARGKAYDATTLKLLGAWLGQTNSYYKCGVLLSVGNQTIAASIQWNGAGHVCLYTVGSASHVFGIPDAEHDATVARVAGNG